MPRYVALLRGINVGKNRRISMEDLRVLVEGLGHHDVRTYVNSGNVVFSSDRTDAPTVAEEIEDAVHGLVGFESLVVIRRADEMNLIVEDNPFPEVTDDPRHLHEFFLSAEPDEVHLTAIDTIETGEDSVQLMGSNAYVHYPNGVLGATLDANALDRMLQVASTSRNWRTVTRLAEMANV